MTLALADTVGFRGSVASVCATGQERSRDLKGFTPCLVASGAELTFNHSMTLVPRGRKSGARHGLKFRSVSANGSRQQRFPFCMGLRGYWNETLHRIVYADGICRLEERQ